MNNKIIIFSILTDNNPGVRMPAEHGLSYLIEYDRKRILFDTGQSDMFLRNAGKMNVDILGVDLYRHRFELYRQHYY